MEVKPGYKPTELGAIPEEWNVRTLGSVATISSGGTPSRRMPEYWNGDIPWVTTAEIDFNTIRETEQYISTLGLKNSAAKLLAPGTLLLALYGQGKTRGKVALLGIQATTNQACAAIVISPEVSRSFMFYYLSGQYRAIRGMSNSGSQDNLSGEIVKSILVPVPPTVTEQDSIAEALKDADVLIDSLERLLVKKRHLKQGAKQELLTGRKRLPGFTEAWKTLTLGQLFSFKNGLNKGKAFFGHGTPIVNYMDVFRDSKIYTANIAGRVELNPQELRTFEVRKGDVLFTRTSETIDEVGMASVILDEPQQAVFSGFVLRGRPLNHAICDEYKAYCFRTKEVRNQITSKASYTTRALTNGRILSGVTLKIPGLPEQAAIASMLSDLDAEIVALEAKLLKARQIKHGMMQELLTGRIRLV